jgi:hypothetical protein
MEGKVPPLPLVEWIQISIRGGKGGTLPSKGIVYNWDRLLQLPTRLGAICDGVR